MEIKWYLPKISSPIGAKIKPIDMNKATFRKGTSFDDISEVIARPHWAEFRSSGDNILQAVVFSGRNYLSTEPFDYNNFIPSL
jgi:hypothetical protein